MKYTLMNKNEPVCILNGDKTGRILEVTQVLNESLLPIGVRKNNILSLEYLQNWWKNNAIPVERDSIRIGLECLGVESPEQLKILGLGLSLNNHYWIQPEAEHYDWNQINYYKNQFDERVGDALFNHKPVRTDDQIFFSPDASLNGALKKKWVVNERGKRILLKGGSGSIAQEPFNEVMAGGLFCAAGIPAVSYELFNENGKIVCICECFTDDMWEYVPAMDLLREYPAPVYPKIHPYKYYSELMERLQVSDAKRILDGMIAIDYIIANTDRHYNNFGLLFNRAEMRYKMAPMFDSGTSLYTAVGADYINPNDDTFHVRPFASYGLWASAEEHIALIEKFAGIDNQELLSIAVQFGRNLLRFGDMSERRVNILCKAILIRYNRLVDILEKKSVVLEAGKGKFSEQAIETISDIIHSQ